MSSGGGLPPHRTGAKSKQEGLMLELNDLETLYCNTPPDTAIAALGVGVLGALFAIPPAFYPEPPGRWTHLGLGLLCLALGILRAASIRREHEEPPPAKIQQFFRLKFTTLALSMTFVALSITIGAIRWADLWGKLYASALMIYVFILLLRPDTALHKHYAAQEQASTGTVTGLRAAGVALGILYLALQTLMREGVLPGASPLITGWIIVSLGLGWAFARLAVVYSLRLIYFYTKE